jgi:hypothetical protein
LKIKLFDVSLRTAYAQAKEFALTQRAVTLLTGGSIRVEERSGSRFVYRYRYDAAGKRITEYLGPESNGETEKRLSQARDEIKEQETIAEYSRSLRRIGFYSADNSTLVTVASLFNAGVFKGAVLVGTHAFGAILNELGVSASPFPMTEDVDVARANRIELAALPEGGFLALLKETGLPFQEVPTLKRGAPATSFKVRGRKLKVDLLVPARGKPYTPVKLPELGAHGMAMPYLEYLLKDAIPSILIGRDRIVPIVVPHPGWLCLHKLVLYSVRTGGENPKREKDLLQAVVLASVLAQDQEFFLTDAIDGTDAKIRSRMKPGIKRALALLKDDSPEAARLIEPLA